MWTRLDNSPALRSTKQNRVDLWVSVWIIASPKQQQWPGKWKIV